MLDILLQGMTEYRRTGERKGRAAAAAARIKAGKHGRNGQSIYIGKDIIEPSSVEKYDLFYDEQYVALKFRAEGKRRVTMSGENSKVKMPAGIVLEFGSKEYKYYDGILFIKR